MLSLGSLGTIHTGHYNNASTQHLRVQRGLEARELVQSSDHTTTSQTLETKKKIPNHRFTAQPETKDAPLDPMSTPTHPTCSPLPWTPAASPASDTRRASAVSTCVARVSDCATLRRIRPYLRAFLDPRTRPAP